MAGKTDVKIPDKLPTRKASEVLQNRSFVFYGRSGSGKTTVAGTFPGPVLLLDMDDKGTDSISDQDHVDIMDIEHWDDLEMVYWWLKKHPNKFKTVVIDTITGAQQMAILKVIEDTNKDPERASEWGVMTRREWGQAASMMKAWVTNFRTLTDDGIEVVFNAQERIFNDGEESSADNQLSPEIGARLMPSVRDHLNASVHVIANTFIRTKIVQKKVEGKKKPKEVEKIQYCVRIGPHPIYDTKVRKPKRVKVPSVIVDPSYDDILSYIQGDE